MKIKLSLLLVFLLFTFSIPLFAQVDSTVSTQGLSLEEYFDNILQHHPIVRQAKTLNEMARQELRLARGNFDPKLKSKFNTKEFGGTQYYETWDSKLEVPIWFNTDINIGYEQNDGTYLNEQLSNTSDGLMYAGLSLPLGRGLFIDERRASVRQAQLMQSMAEADKVKAINKVLLSAAKAYWDWYYAYQYYTIVTEVRSLAEERYNGIVQQVINGDVAPFDSLKAFINFQERVVEQEQAELEYTNASIQASAFMWLSNEDESIPLQFARETYPQLNPSNSEEFLDLTTLKVLQDSARLLHPEIVKLDLKNQQLKIDQRLSREWLKPEINLKYNVLLKPSKEENTLFEPSSDIFANDYKLGLEVYFPLLLRKERAKLQQNTIKLEQNYYERVNQFREVENSIEKTYNTLSNIVELRAMQEQMVDNYQRLLNGELTKFENGESSIFLINTRETELLDAKVKLLKLSTKYEKAKIELLYAAGVPYLQN
ncbi:TolC family protein [Porifericola rhodea]|uniref:TolC family protein n=1 Tax=Porifericola rhodea TaxID=930972 RepID=UPI0026668BE5|nr:TolC family protein [Porifericola rhodea]WKN32051.1 TolC family protein [Porifericola rhodea]